MKKQIEKLFWEMSKSTYPSGSSTNTNAILEHDFNEIIDKIVLIKEKANLSDSLPECTNCHNKMQLYGIAYECKCGVVKLV